MKNPIPLFLIPLAETAGVNASRSSDKQFAQFVKKSLGRYFLQDWGEMCEEDKKANNWSLNHNERILASYSDKENALKAEWVIGTISGEIFRKYLKADQNLNGWSVFPS